MVWKSGIDMGNEETLKSYRSPFPGRNSHDRREIESRLIDIDGLPSFRAKNPTSLEEVGFFNCL
jgi:hypothetical protein